jgi:hexulose-6-phosphate isomerase
MSNDTRRHFLKAAAATIAAGALAPHLLAAPPKLEVRKGLKKAVKYSMIKLQGSVLDKFQLVKDLGFDGVETDSPGGPNTDEANEAQAKTGVKVHGVIDSVHWGTRLSDPREETRAKGLEALKGALRDAAAMGAGTVLLVPGRVSKKPEDNENFEQVWERSTEQVKKAIPLAEELKVPICIETVWNEFITSPKHMIDYVDQFKNPIVGAYFDISNMLKYGVSSPDWIRQLGKRLYKVDCKGYSLDKAKQPGGNGWCEIGEGSENWPEVLKALQEVGYTDNVGWVTAEVGGGGKERLAVIAEQMNKVLGLK